MTKSHGFSLIEVAIVVTIIGIIITIALPQLRVYKATADFYETEEKITRTNNAIREYFSLNGRYPCPADPTLSKDDINYGVEVCPPQPSLTCPAEINCTSTGTRDADGDSTPDTVLIGALPVTTLADDVRFADFNFSDGQDAYDLQLTYAVTRSMALEAPTNSLIRPANVQLGAIFILDEFNEDLTEPPGSAHYIVVSHGRNSRGGYNFAGNQVPDCDVTTLYNSLPGPPPPVADIDVAGTPGLELELENCDNDDGRFISGLMSFVEGDTYFDDHIAYTAKNTSSLWRQSAIDPNDLYNTNFGSVGIGVIDPVEKLDVNGALRAETSITADGGFCDTADPTECLNPDALGGTAMTRCAAGFVATGIEGNNLVCEALFAGGVTFNCPSGQFVTGFTNLGTVYCATP